MEELSWVLSGPNVISRVLIRRRQKDRGERDREGQGGRKI